MLKKVTTAKVTAAVVCAAAIAVTAAGCARVGVDGAAASSATIDTSSCTASLRSLGRVISGEDASNPPFARFLSYQAATGIWQKVAMQCPARYSQGIIQSAYAAVNAQRIASDNDIAVSAISTAVATDTANPVPASEGAAYSGVVAADPQSIPTTLGDSAQAALSLAQDKAAFSYEVLAARSSGQTSLDERTMSLQARDASAKLAENLSQDPRLKVYSVGNLLDHPQNITDPSTGLAAPTTASIEMTLALDEIAGSNNLETDEQRATAAQFIIPTVARAYELGFPMQPLPLTKD